MSQGSVISVAHLHKSFTPNFWERPRQVLRDITFEVPAHRTTGFIGINGSGKTTTLKCILGFIHPERGDVLFFGQQRSKEVLARIGYLPERPYLYEYLTTYEFLRLHWELTGGGSGFQDAANEVLRRVNLLKVENRRLRNFSKGMMQRIGLAQALLRSPELLILDEPMSGLDPDGRFLVKDVIRQERAKGTTVFFSSHFLNDIEELCEDLVVIDGGRILYQGPTLSLISRNIPRYRIASRAGDEAPINEELCELPQLSDRIKDLEKSGRQLTSVANEYVALEVAFQNLREEGDRRGDKTEGTR